MPPAKRVPSNTTLTMEAIEVDPALLLQSPDDGDYMESDGDTTDSTYSSNHARTVAALPQSLRSHTYENGRRYHGYRAGKYMLPNDEFEQERMDFHYHCIMWHFGGQLFHPPLRELSPPIHRVLDVGCGCGTWCINMAEQFPSAEIYGLDLSPVDVPWTPPNVQFTLDDCEDPWPFPASYFNYIHIQTMAGSIRDWPTLLQRCVIALTPGGYVELVDHASYFSCDDGSIVPDQYLPRWLGHMAEAMARIGCMSVEVTDQWESMLERVGLRMEGTVVRKAPVGEWPRRRELKEIGRAWREMFAGDVEGMSLRALVTVLGWTQEDALEFAAGVRRELEDTSIHSHGKLVAVWARKPDQEEATEDVAEPYTGFGWMV